MMSLRNQAKVFSERYHGELHFLFGVLTAVLVLSNLGGDWLTVILISSIAAFLPDIDHVFFLFLYGRNTKYATEARKILLDSGFIKYIEYCKLNHKNNTEIKSHNMIVVAALALLSVVFWLNNNPLLAAFFISNTLHFVFDILEDLLFFGKLNGNWWLKFGQKR